MGPTGRPCRGARVTPPARLVRLHRHNVTNVLVMGGSAEQRLQIAYAFHRESLVRRGPFVCVDGERDELRLRMSIQSRVSSMCPDVPADPLRAAEHGTFFLDSVDEAKLRQPGDLFAALDSLLRAIGNDGLPRTR